ncbi:MAG TPA: excinuclease ABC subunit UvrC [Patescibacteria group bacterium]|jgi:excinuclease ABC subunit C
MHRVSHQLATLPAKPGVYLFKDETGKILYVGKAKRLRTRVRSYFSKRAEAEPKTRVFVPKIHQIDTVVTKNEVEALLLESNFIKQYRPPYNVRLRDDKQYVFIKVTLGDRYPRVTTTRRVTDKRARYFGPYTDGRAVRATLKTLRKVFPHCLPNDPCDDPSRSRPCLYFHLGLCPSPQYGKISDTDYRANIDGLMRALDGKTDDVQERLRTEMREASQRHAFERAAALRDRIGSLEALLARQQAVDPKLANRDVIGQAHEGRHAAAILLTVRQGRVVARKDFDFQNADKSTEAELLDGFLGQYYKAATNLPDEVLVPLKVPGADTVSEYLSERCGRKVSVRVPRQGNRRQLLELAEENAREHLARLKARWNSDVSRREQGLADLSQALGMSAPPPRIECYDVSTLGGTATVGSMVVMRDGAPSPAHYRRFRIATVKGVDDFGAMREMLGRRFKRVKRSSDDESFGALPDLVVIDGGKGQVSAAAGVLEELGLSDVPLIGLAKRFEEVWRWDGKGSTPVRLPKDAPGSLLLQQLRDEAHRFAITYGRKTARKTVQGSVLDRVPGVGPAKKKLLIRHFGSVRGVRDADLSAIQAVVGKAAGRAVKENL